jgi:hypothetical protein
MLMADIEDNTNEEETKEFSIEIKISNKNLQYRSDFSEPETVFWLDAVKNLIYKNTFEQNVSES